MNRLSITYWGKIKPYGSILLVGPVLFFVYLMVKITIPYLSFRYDVDFLLTKQSILHISVWRYSFYTHITSSLLVLLCGAFQFNRYTLERFPLQHRRLGKLYIFTVLFLSAPSGLIMSFYANGGVWPKISFVITSVLWWWFTYKGLGEIRKGNINAHRSFMIRSFALTLSAITLRAYVFFLPQVVHLSAREMYTLVAWLSWIPNLLIAERLIWKKLA